MYEAVECPVVTYDRMVMENMTEIQKNWFTLMLFIIGEDIGCCWIYMLY